MRTTLRDVRYSRLPQIVGLCADDRPSIAALVNEIQQRLLFDGGDSGFWGSWEKVLFTPSRSNPYITLPRQYARAVNLAVCRSPVRIQNQFYTVLPGGPGLPPATSVQDWCGDLAGYDEGTTPTMVDLPATSYLRLYATDPADVAAAARVLITGLDQNGAEIYEQDGFNNVQGFYLTLDTPFVDSTFTVSKILGIQKDVTQGSVTLKAVDPTTGVETTLATYAPNETTPAYRRYRLTSLPTQCCNNTTSCSGTSTTNPVTVTALCKLEYIPVTLDTDYLIIGNIPAMIEEAQSIRMSEMDNPAAMSKAEYHHKRAVTQLQNELRHYMGDQVPAISVDIWDNEPLIYQNIGGML